MEGKIGSIHTQVAEFEGPKYTNEEFVRALLSDTDLTPPNLPSSIVLPQFRSMIDFLYDNAQLVGEYDRSFTDHIERELAVGKYSQMSEEDKEVIRLVANGKVAGERAIAFMSDESSQLKPSEISYGEERNVRVNFDQDIRFLIHTHPNNYPFSPQDNSLLLTGNLEGKRLMRSQMVLAPDFQLLALATSQTPILPPFDAEVIREEYNTLFYEAETPEVESLANKYVEVRDRNYSNVEFANQQYEDYATVIHQKITAGTITQEEGDKVLEFEAKNRDRILFYAQKRHEKVVIPRLVNAQIANDTTTWILLSRMARELNIAWYISSDKHTFSRVEPGNVVVLP